MRRKKKIQSADDEEERNDPAEHFGHPAVGDLAGVLDAVRLELLGQLGVLDADRRERLALLGVRLVACRAPSSRQRDFLDLVLAHERLEIAVGDRLAGLELEKNACASASSSRNTERRTTPRQPGRAGRVPSALGRCGGSVRRVSL